MKLLEKSQRFGAISFMIAGVIMVVACLLTKGTTCFITAMAIFVVLLIVDVIYTYRIAKKY